MTTERVSVLGGGSWGTALANHLADTGREVVLWCRDARVAESINRTHRNPAYFGDRPLKTSLKATDKLTEAVADATHIVVATPSSSYRTLCAEMKAHVPSSALVVSTAKGLEEGTHARLSAVLMQELGSRVRIAVLSGPSFASEVFDGQPTAVTSAGYHIEAAQRTATLFHSKQFRVYTTDDVVGVELGGALKNVYAIAVGIVDGRKMGSNARAAIMTRGLAEMQRLIMALGGDANTVMGLSGLGDLILTATGDLSRNRRAGIGLGQEKSLETVLQDIGQTVEGVGTTLKAAELARKMKVSMPIVEGMEQVLTGKIAIAEAVKLLLSREPRAEFDN